MRMAVFPLGALQTNCYVAASGANAVVVDPGGDPAPVLAYLKENRLTLSHILLTHLHFDHTFGVAPLARETGAVVLASPADEYMLETDLGRGGVWGLPEVETFRHSPLTPGDLALPVGDCKVLATPGHTPGGLSFYFPKLASVCAGDTLFARSVGRTDFPGGNLETLMDSIINHLYTLPDDTTVYPGHGPKTTIGDERLNNPFVGEFTSR
jgi:hydroxyacylglutathione hydrolase